MTDHTGNQSLDSSVPHPARRSGRQQRELGPHVGRRVQQKPVAAVGTDRD